MDPECFAIINAAEEKIAQNFLHLLDRDCFGVNLDKFMNKQVRRLPFLHVPWIIKKCVDIILTGPTGPDVPLFGAPYQKKIGKMPVLTPIEASNVIKRFLTESPEELLSVDPQSNEKLEQAIKEFNVSGIREHVRKIPLFRQVVMKEIFWLCAVLINKGKYDVRELALRFGPELLRSLDNDLRRDLCISLIDHYQEIFAEIDKLPSPSHVSFRVGNEHTVVHIYTDTGRILDVEIKLSISARYLVRKLHGALSESNTIRLYVVLDRQIRAIHDEEIISEIHKQGIGIILCSTRVLVKEIREQKDEPETGTEILSGTDPKDSDESSSMLVISHASIEGSEMSISKPTRLDSASSGRLWPKYKSKACIVLPEKHKVWIYTDTNNNKAGSWSTGIEAEAVLSLDPNKTLVHCVITVQDGKTYDYSGDKLFTVVDSSSYFAFVDESNNEQPILGIGFPNRIASSIFRVALGELLTTAKKNTNLENVNG